MKILIATPLYPPDVGGPATYSELLVREFPARGVSVSVEVLNRINAPFGVKHLIYFFRLVYVARDADIVYAQDPLGTGLPAFFAARLLGKKFLLKVVGDRAWEEFLNRGNDFISPEDFQGMHAGFSVYLRKRVQTFVAKHAKRVIVPSQYLKRLLVSGWGVPEERVLVIYNAFEPPMILLPRDKAREKVGISGLVLVSVGRLVPWKGFRALVESMPDTIAEFPDAKLYIIGDGPEKTDIWSAIARLGLKQHVFLIGKMPHNDMLAYMSAADLFVLNTGYEGLSHAILEAMALSVPVVTTGVGGNPELISDGVHGRLVAYGDSEALVRAIGETLRDMEARGRFSAAAQKKALEFSKEKMLRELSSLFEKLS
ncbi:MAG: hypothetical protein COW88_03550 [Candidatus Lloydbacteria bacterium CG22_combo_CG10-13_8_21_14_all_47_15]|uniref:Glycosyl transferase family 1 domain-containing protein n=1 Tax=Candidatus Lloydbacteria bacterium CG22_combo_CG10-13_8_21_14_all_47_15 TaxID=1974635 RepID=A0A2H0CSS4_9BACT|nr:MAG: hypothetical protein COW88_03550 [Candidatus Lloydbacteria bacterium CG22_combo_CG10-13_8_21_14_all_47_15]